MSKTPSTMLELGTTAPAFELFNPTSGDHDSIADINSKGVVVAFICNHCPYVVLIMEKFSEIATAYQAKGIEFIAINSNDVANYPDDSPEKMVEFAKQYNLTFPYLFDEDQSIAKAYQAACTPDLFLFDADKKLTYRGQFDAARPKADTEINGADLTAAMDALLSNQAAPEPQLASLGCNIKWKEGNEPSYFG
ncbi:MAG: thioredoxin family protein [Methylococcales bacterium]|jgi:peroxiredoxin|nr:thioredoxin family protein [Methylococcales bacterium]MBT7445191.1 thioredoxin family protein [Methylococcales bacterium]